ncbi:long-chain fatty acid--CoA ligase [Caldimonas thermodepolymerans]|uniref:Long-chain fatty acid--CoA ligase n=1 Tax=Caldimonas thermodepolymerans TaxID=215580 RepID=A0A2S5T9C0_9BURK|nr:long-chain fatty acid--CoA ligase [Caldimonas thermodepolymerans]PPE71546.1 long-chain fatty acid--CoA ligase [Caldimonas thermodepolymerans]QPC30573.1 long-chain fatty acid--CoA ligase [Caldimonas thermodepolymerans]RDI02831.1 fatty-acyl-CoA synthase [Caldimonas thermodepolymerans]
MSAPVDPPHAKFWPRRLPRALTVPETSLWFNLEVSAARYPNKDCLIFFGRRYTYAEVLRQAEALAGWLQQHAGVRRGDRVLLYTQNCPQHVIATYAILRADAVVVPVNPMNRTEELKHYITDPEAKVAICSAELAGYMDAASAALPPAQRLQHLLVTRYADAMPAQDDPQDAPPPAMAEWLRADPPLPAGAVRWTDAIASGMAPGAHTARPDDLAVMPYTSGTTGLPKGCMHSHRTMMHNVVGGSLWSQGGADSVTLGVVPMFHITGMQYCMHTPIWGGSSVVLMPRWDRELAGRLISRHRVTHWTCVPTMVIDLLGSPNMDRFDLSSLTYLGGGGAAMPQAVAERLHERYGLLFAEGYGLTETAAPSHANPPERPKLQCLGMPFFGVDSRVVDPETLRPLPPGEVGEILIHGPQVFLGYWRKPEATEAAFVEIDGKRFFRSGDLGYTDDEGYFYITDRLKRMINASGYKVWPAEVEALLYKHPAVQEACVIATRDAYRGESVKAVIVLKDAARGQTTGADIIEWARQNMAAYKYPRVVEFVDALPKSGSGKVMWRLLQEQEDRRAQAA